MTILTTTRPLTNADRLQVWKDKINSPPQGQPGQFRVLPVFRELVGLVLFAVSLGAFLMTMKWFLD